MNPNGARPGCTGARQYTHNSAHTTYPQVPKSGAATLRGRATHAFENTWRHAGARVHRYRYTSMPRTHLLHPLITCDDYAHLWHVSQVDGRRWHVITIVFSEHRRHAAVQSAAARPSAANEAGELASAAARLCSRRRGVQERFLAQRTSRNATLPSPPRDGL